MKVNWNQLKANWNQLESLTIPHYSNPGPSQSIIFKRPLQILGGLPILIKIRHYHTESNYTQLYSTSSQFLGGGIPFKTFVPASSLTCSTASPPRKCSLGSLCSSCRASAWRSRPMAPRWRRSVAPFRPLWTKSPRRHQRFCSGSWGRLGKHGSFNKRSSLLLLPWVGIFVDHLSTHTYIYIYVNGGMYIMINYITKKAARNYFCRVSQNLPSVVVASCVRTRVTKLDN